MQTGSGLIEQRRERLVGQCWRERMRRYRGGRGPSSDDSFHSPTVNPLLALNKPSVMKRYHRRRTCSHTSPRRSTTMVTLHDTRFDECRWWNDGLTVKTCRHLTVVGLHDTGSMRLNVVILSTYRLEVTLLAYEHKASKPS